MYRIWYFGLCSDRASQELARTAAERYPEAELTVFLPGAEYGVVSGTPASRIRTYPCRKSPVRAVLCNAFALSYEMQQAIRALAAQEPLPDAIILPEKNAAAYYTLTDWYQNPEFYADCAVYVEDAPEAAPGNAPDYLLPYWWVAQQARWCHRAARRSLPAAGSSCLSRWIAEDRALPAPTAYPLGSVRKQTPIPADLPVGTPGLLTVIVPYYNLGRYLPQALASIFSVDYPQLEVLLIDDGSTDPESLTVLQEMEQKYAALRVVRQANAGLSAVRNRGAQLASGEYITFVDADDTVSPSYYTEAVRLLQRYQNAGYVSSWMELFGEAQGIKVYFPSSLPALLLDNTQCHACVCRKNVFLAFGHNSSEMKGGMEDHDFWIHFAENGYFSINIPKPYYQYRISGGSMSAAFGRDAARYRQPRLYQLLEARHTALYREYSSEICNLLMANGPAYLWPGPAGYHTAPMYDDQMRREWTLARQHIHNLESSRAYRLLRKFRK